VGDFSRFPTADALLKYSGMVPSLYQSGTVERRGRMEKKGPWLLRYALVQAAQKVVLHYPKGAEYYRRKCSEGKFYKVALAHVAAKLLKAIWLIETRGLEFDESRF
jgi:transposase